MTYDEIRRGRVQARVRRGWGGRVPFPDRKGSWGPEAEVRKEGDRKRGLRIPVADGAYLVKEYQPDRWWRALRSAFAGPPAYRELDMALAAARRRLPVAVPVAAGLYPAGGLRRRSFLISHALATARPLDALLLDGEIRGAARRRLLGRYGALARKAHNAGFHQEDFDPNNAICVDPGAEDLELQLIDMERVHLRSPLSRSEQAWSLARLLRYGRALPVVEQMRFLRGYVADEADRRRALRTLAMLVQRTWEEVMERAAERARRTCLRPGRMFRRFRVGRARGIHRVRYGEREEPIFEMSQLERIVAPFLEGKAPGDAQEYAEPVPTRVGPFELTFETYPARLRSTYSHARWAWRERNAALGRERMEEVPVALLEIGEGWLFRRGFVILGRADGYRTPYR